MRLSFSLKAPPVILKMPPVILKVPPVILNEVKNLGDSSLRSE